MTSARVVSGLRPESGPGAGEFSSGTQGAALARSAFAEGESVPVVSLPAVSLGPLPPATWPVTSRAV